MRKSTCLLTFVTVNRTITVPMRMIPGSRIKHGAYSVVVFDGGDLRGLQFSTTGKHRSKGNSVA